MRRIVLSVSLFIAFIAGSAHAEEPPCSRDLTQYRMQAWRADDGLPLDTVLAIAQTPDGFVWVGTEGGLARFDGHQFVAHDLQTDEREASAWIEALVVTHDGTLLVGTESGGLLAIDGPLATTRQVFDWPHKISAITITADGRVWFGPRGGPLMVLDDLSGEARAVTDGGQDATITALAQRAAGGVWVGYSGTGLAIAAGDRIAVTPMPAELGDLHVESLQEDSEGLLWIGAREGYFQWDGTILTTLSAPGNFATDLLLDRNGTMWAATSGDGLVRFCPGAIQRLTSADGLPLDLVQAVLEDAHGSIWAATSGGGLVHLSTGAALPITSRQGLPDAPILPIRQAADGSIWVGTFGGGLARRVDGTWIRVGERDGLPSNWVFSLAESPGGDMWVGSRGGITRFAGGRAVETLTTDDGLPANAVVSLVQEGQRLWIGTIEGLAVLEDGRITRLHPPDGSFDGHIISMHAARDGTLWVGTNGSGLFQVIDGRVVRPPLHDQIAGSMIPDFHERPDGVMWITTSRGVVRWDGTQVGTVTSRHGLPDPMISSMLDDGFGFTWLSSNRGIFRIAHEELEAVATGQRETMSVQHFGQVDGMPMSETNGGFEPSAWRDDRGRLWYPTTAGIAVFDPAAIAADERTTNVLILSVGDGTRLIDASEVASFGARPPYLDFSFTAPEFMAPHFLKFRYRLLGRGDWYLTQDRHAVYHRPPPGELTFEVQARIGNGPWSATAATTVLVERHLLQHAGFWAAAVVLLLAAILGGLHWRQRVRDRLRERQQEAQKLEAIGLMAGGVAHDFNNVLTAIIGGTESVLAKVANQPSAARDAEAVLAAADKAAALTRQLLTFGRRRPGTPQWLDAAAELAGMEDFLRRILTSKIELRLDAGTACGEIYIDRIQLQQVVLNLVTNARDAMPDGGIIEISLRRVDRHTVRITVRDNGMGMDAATRRRLFEPFFTTKGEGQGTGLGLAVSYSIIHQARGNIEVESKPGAGAAFHVYLPARDAPTGR